MPKSQSKISLTTDRNDNKLMQEAANSRIIHAVRQHMLEDIGVDNLTVGFSLDFGLVIDW